MTVYMRLTKANMVATYCNQLLLILFNQLLLYLLLKIHALVCIYTYIHKQPRLACHFTYLPTFNDDNLLLYAVREQAAQGPTWPLTPWCTSWRTDRMPTYLSTWRRWGQGEHRWCRMQWVIWCKIWTTYHPSHTNHPIHLCSTPLTPPILHPPSYTYCMCICAKSPPDFPSYPT